MLLIVKRFIFWTLDLRWKTNLSVSKLGWNKALESAKPSQRDLFQYGIVRSYNSVTRLGDLLHFGQHLMPLATIILPNLPTFLGNLCKGVKIFDFSSEIILGNIFRHLATFSWSHSHTEIYLQHRLKVSCVINFFSSGLTYMNNLWYLIFFDTKMLYLLVNRTQCHSAENWH